MKFSDKRVQNIVKKIVRESKGWREGYIVASISDTKGVDVYHSDSGFQAYPGDNFSSAQARIIYEGACEYDSADEGFDENQVEVELF